MAHAKELLNRNWEAWMAWMPSRVLSDATRKKRHQLESYKPFMIISTNQKWYTSWNFRADLWFVEIGEIYITLAFWQLVETVLALFFIQLIILILFWYVFNITSMFVQRMQDEFLSLNVKNYCIVAHISGNWVSVQKVEKNCVALLAHI